MQRDSAELLTPKAVAQIYKFSEKTLANWRTLGIGPDFFKVGNRCFYRRTEIEEFVEMRRVYCKQR